MYVSTNCGANRTSQVSVDIIGRLGGVTQFTHTVASGSGNWTDDGQGFTLVNFTAGQQTTAIDEILISPQANPIVASGEINYIAMDNFAWTSATLTWNGNTDNDWDTSSNWDTNSVPSTSNNVVIPSGLTNYPTASGAVTINTTTIHSGASLIAQSTFSGTITYNRNLANTNWYLVSSPVVGQTIADFYTNESPALGSGTGDAQNIAIAPYDNSQSSAADRWNYYTEGQVDGNDGDDTTDTFGIGTGYAVLLQSAGDISFTGTMSTDDVGVSITDGTGSGGNPFNLVGNPYPSYIAADNSADAGNNLLKINDTDNDFLTESTLWFWNQNTNSYDQVNHTSSFFIAPGQGFFVSSNGSNTLSITEAMQSHQGTDSFQRTSTTRKEINLVMTNGTEVRDADIFYIDGTTTGFDNGYDSSIFGGVANEFAIYTHTVSNGIGRNLGIQSLPIGDLENMIIPVGINAVSGMELIISASSINLSTELAIYLEDKEDHSFTLLNNSSDFTRTLTSDLNGIGRFYLHVSSEVLSINTVNLDNISIYTFSENNLRIVGVQNGNAQVSFYNILGVQVMKTAFKGNGLNDIALPNLKAGVYVIQLETEIGKLNKKVIIE